jgi:ubiquinone biosynthesis protein COQ4
MVLIVKLANKEPTMDRHSNLAVAASALWDLARNPSRLDRVFDLGVALNARRLPGVVARLEHDAEARRLLAERPSIDSRSVDLAALARLPDGTLGREYARFLHDNNISPDVFKKPALADERAAYVMQRIRQTHDLWHVLTGYAPDVRGEVLLQAFTYAQLKSPSSLALTLLAALRHPRLWLWRALGQAYRRGRATRPLATFRWEEHWHKPVAELRRELGCPSV